MSGEQEALVESRPKSLPPAPQLAIADIKTDLPDEATLVRFAEGTKPDWGDTRPNLTARTGGTSAEPLVPSSARTLSSGAPLLPPPSLQGSFSERSLGNKCFTLPRLRSASTEPDPGFDRPAECFYARHLHANGSCGCFKRRLRAAPGFVQSVSLIGPQVGDSTTREVIPRGLGVGGGPPGQLQEVLKRLDMIRSDPGAADSLERRVRSHHQEERKTQLVSVGERKVGAPPATIWEQNRSLVASWSPQRVREAQTDRFERAKERAERAKVAKHESDLAKERLRQEAWSKNQRRLDLLSTPGLKLNMAQRAQLSKWLAIFIFSARFNNIKHALREHQVARERRRQRFRAVLIIQRAFRRSQNEKSFQTAMNKENMLLLAAQMDRATRVIQNAVRARMLSPIRHYGRRLVAAMRLVVFLEKVRDDNAIKLLVRQLFVSVRVIQRYWRKAQFVLNARRRILLVQWEKYEKEQLIKAKTETKAAEETLPAPPALKEEKSGSKVSPAKGARGGPPPKEPDGHHRGIQKVQMTVKLLVVEASIKARMRTLLVDLKEYHKEMEMLAPGWSRKVEVLEVNLLSVMPEMARMLHEKRGLEPRWRSVYSQADLALLHSVGEKSQEQYVVTQPPDGEQHRSEKWFLLHSRIKTGAYNMFMQALPPKFIPGSVIGTATAANNQQTSSTGGCAYSASQRGKVNMVMKKTGSKPPPPAPDDSFAQSPVHTPEEGKGRPGRPGQKGGEDERGTSRERAGSRERADKGSGKGESLGNGGGNSKASNRVVSFQPTGYTAAGKKQQGPSEGELNKYGKRTYAPEWAAHLQEHGKARRARRGSTKEKDAEKDQFPKMSVKVGARSPMAAQASQDYPSISHFNRRK